MADHDLPGDGEVYLGDGAYVRFDGWSLMLRAPRAHGDDIIVLGPLEWQTLRQFVNRHPGMHRHLEGAPNPTGITCPRCRQTSYNLNDVANRYCGHCHQDIP